MGTGFESCNVQFTSRFNGILISDSSFEKMEITLDISTVYFTSRVNIISKIKYKNSYVILSTFHRGFSSSITEQVEAG
jgi:hypothetical protein